MNKRYEDLKVAEGVYVPDLGLNYPEEDPFEGMYKPVYDREYVVDEHYPFVDDSAEWRRKHKLGYRFLLKIGLGLKMRIQMGLRIKGREHLKAYREALAGGAITIANHCYRLDCPAVLIAVGAKWTTKIPMFAPNFQTKDGVFMRMVGGIPIPPVEAGLAAMKQFNAAFDEFHRRGYWFHIFPEAKRWDFYKPLRPFQKGAFTMAYKYNMPLVPCVVTYRERTGIYRLFGPKQMPLLQVEIGEPILPNTTSPRKEEVERLRTEAHERMERIAGIEHNTWPVSLGNL